MKKKLTNQMKIDHLLTAEKIADIENDEGVSDEWIRMVTSIDKKVNDESVDIKFEL